jgi:hypothetical protein
VIRGSFCTRDYRAEAYRDADAARWDALVAAAPTGNLLHTRAFLAYHGDRFDDRSLLFVDPAGQVGAVLPAAVDPGDPARVVSHPGSTYGGLLVAPGKSGRQAMELLPLACRALAAQGFDRLLYKCVPPHLHAGAHQVDLYALWRLGGALVRRDLWNTLDLTQPRVVDADRARRLRRAHERDLRVGRETSADAYAQFHALLADRLRESHGQRPVHSVEEMCWLQAAFPAAISLWLARDGDGRLLAGVWIFDLGPAWHQQYGAADARGRELAAQDLLLDTVIGHATAAGARHFSFGASTQDQGRVLNAGLFHYKAGLGEGAVVQDFYELDLRTVSSLPDETA